MGNYFDMRDYLSRDSISVRKIISLGAKIVPIIGPDRHPCLSDTVFKPSSRLDLLRAALSLTTKEGLARTNTELLILYMSYKNVLRRNLF